jgi:HK97 gp10 family phage protein
MSKEIDLSDFSKEIKSRASNINSNLEKAIGLCCKKVKDDIQYSMAHTQRDTTKTYFTNSKSVGHHPSLPNNPPAPDTGNLRDSINYEIKNSDKTVYGLIGSTQKNPDYAVYTEYGTSKMAPRPWLRPAMQRNNDWIRSTLAKAIKGTMSGGNQ